jgi:spermidine synthase
MSRKTNKDLWIDEPLTPWDVCRHKVRRVLYDRKTKFQHAQIIDGGHFGRKLFIDGEIQSSTMDEFIYHESLVHPAMFAHGAPKTVLIMGGGEGATLREVLRWKTVQRATMVDIDAEVVAACQRHLPSMHKGAFDDARAELIIDDALDVLRKAGRDQQLWDVVISDITSPTEDGAGNFCFTKEYFAAISRVLAPGGIMVTQSGPVVPEQMTLHVRASNSVAKTFPHTLSYSAPIPSYWQHWGFTLAGRKQLAPLLRKGRIANIMQRRIKGKLEYLDAAFMETLAYMPAYVKQAFATEKRIYSARQLPQRVDYV